MIDLRRIVVVRLGWLLAQPPGRLTLWHTLRYSVKHRLQHRCYMKVRENRVRRMAERQGYILEKSRRRDPRAKDYGLYRLLVDHRDLETHRATTRFSQTLDEIESFLAPLDE